jgi:hypothetical protein
MPRRVPTGKEPLSPDFSVTAALAEAIELLKLEAERLGTDENGLILDSADQARREKALVEASVKLELLRLSLEELGLN